MNNNVELPKMSNETSNNNNQPIDEINNDGIKAMFKYVTTRDSKDLFILFIRLLIIVAIIIVCKFPFDLLKEAGTNLFIMFGITISTTLLNIWQSIVNIVYCILAIYAFYKIIKTRFKNLNNK